MPSLLAHPHLMQVSKSRLRMSMWAKSLRAGTTLAKLSRPSRRSIPTFTAIRFSRLAFGTASNAPDLLASPPASGGKTGREQSGAKSGSSTIKRVGGDLPIACQSGGSAGILSDGPDELWLEGAEMMDRRLSGRYDI